MTGYRDGHMAVEPYKAGWVLRAALPGDRPITDSQQAQHAMAAWRLCNQQKFSEATPCRPN